MTENNRASKIRQAAGVTALIGSIAVGIFAFDSRYAKSAEFEKYTQRVEKTINKIYIQQLRQEEREILKTPVSKLTASEKRRLDDIQQEVRNLRQ